MSTTVNPHQSSANGRLAFVLLSFRSIVDDPFAKLVRRLVGFTIEGRVGGQRKAQRPMHDRRVPDHRRRSLFAKGPQASLQFLGTRTCRPRAIAAEGDEVSHLPPIAEKDFDASTKGRRQGPQDGEGQLGDSLFKLVLQLPIIAGTAFSCTVNPRPFSPGSVPRQLSIQQEIRSKLLPIRIRH